MKTASFSRNTFSGVFFFFSSRRRHTRFDCDWSSDVCSSDLILVMPMDGWFLDGVANPDPKELEGKSSCTNVPTGPLPGFQASPQPAQVNQAPPPAPSRIETGDGKQGDFKAKQSVLGAFMRSE